MEKAEVGDKKKKRKKRGKKKKEKKDFPRSQKPVIEAQLGVGSGSLGSRPQEMHNREKTFPVRKHLIFKAA